jgi:hypothetical protein
LLRIFDGWGIVMNRIVLLVCAPLLLSACGGTKNLPTEELRQLKPACAGGDTAVCAEIGHKVRRDRAEAAYLAQTTE